MIPPLLEVFRCRWGVLEALFQSGATALPLRWCFLLCYYFGYNYHDVVLHLLLVSADVYAACHQVQRCTLLCYCQHLSGGSCVHG